MNYLVFLDSQAGELEKILSGVKTMVIKGCDPARLDVQPVRHGDSLYFLRDHGESAPRVKATVVGIYPCWKHLDEDLAQLLKEMQAKLQLTEDQYNRWSAKQQVLLVEFGSAHKISVVRVPSNKVTDQPDWIPFEDFSLIKE